MKYEPKRFSEIGAPVKRSIEQEFFNIAKDFGIKGNVLGIVGPELKAHCNNYQLIANNHKIIICEIEKEIYNYQKTLPRPINTTIKNIDVFEELIKNSPKLAFLDLDFCCNINTVYEQGFHSAFKKALQNNKFNINFGLILTFSQRNAMMGTEDLKSFIIKTARQYNYTKRYSIERIYTDTRPGMETWLILFKKSYSLR